MELFQANSPPVRAAGVQQYKTDMEDLGMEVGFECGMFKQLK